MCQSSQHSSQLQLTTLTSSNAGVSLGTVRHRFSVLLPLPRMIQVYNQQTYAPKAPQARVCRASARQFIVGVPDTRRSRRPLKRYPTDFAALHTSNMGALHNDIEKVLYTEEAIAQAVNKLGK